MAVNVLLSCAKYMGRPGVSERASERTGGSRANGNILAHDGHGGGGGVNGQCGR